MHLNLSLAKHSLHCTQRTHTSMLMLILYTWIHHRAHPLALSQHVILMMRCGMPHYRHTKPCSYSTIDGPGAFFTSLDPPGVMLRHKVRAHHTMQQNTHSQIQYWLCWKVSQSSSTHTEYTQWGLINNGKWVFYDNLFRKNKIPNNCQYQKANFPSKFIHVQNIIFPWLLLTTWQSRTNGMH